MSRVEPNPQTISRDGAIYILRAELLRLAGDDVSICKLAAEKNIFCRGFHRHSDVELRRRFDWINEKNPRLPRAAMEEVVDRWQLARQEVDGLPTACDVQQREHDGCRGWDDFSNEELSRFCHELMGRNVIVH